jgi:peptidoglycan/LPS O-acetylase OafA/YrhL
MDKVTSVFKDSLLLRFAVLLVPTLLIAYLLMPTNYRSGMWLQFAYHSGNYGPALLGGMVAGWLAYRWEAFIHTSFWLIILTMLIFNVLHQDGNISDWEFYVRLAFGSCFSLVFLTLIIKHHWKENKQEVAPSGDVDQPQENEEGNVGESN